MVKHSNHMTVSHERVEELKIILREDYGKEVSDAEAYEIANNAVDYFNLLAKIYHRMQQDADGAEVK